MTATEDDIRAYARVVARAFMARATVRQIVDAAEAKASRMKSTTIYSDRPGGILGEMIVDRLYSYVDPALDPSKGMDVFGTGDVLEDSSRIGASWADQVKDEARRIVMEEWKLPGDYCPRAVAVWEMADLVRSFWRLDERAKAVNLRAAVEAAVLMEEESQRLKEAGLESDDFTLEGRIGEVIQKCGFPEIPGYAESAP